jgi:uncharacterized protein YjdB
MKRVLHVMVGGLLISASAACGGSEGAAGVPPVPQSTVTSVEVAAASTAPLFPGQTVALTATTRDASGRPLSGRTVTWTSSTPAVATVSTSGLVTAVAVGSATISATSEGRSGSLNVAVAPVPVAAVVVSPPSASLVQGTTRQLTAEARDNTSALLSGRVITWTSSNAAVATVSTGGLVAAVSPGTVTITAAAEGVQGTAAIVVTAIPVASVLVTPTTPSVEEGLTQSFTAAARDAAGGALTGRPVAWTSSNASVATISAMARVQKIAIGANTNVQTP